MFHWIRKARNRYTRTAVEEVGEELRIDGGTHDYHFERGVTLERSLQQQQQKVHLSVPLVGFVNDHMSHS